MSGGSSSGVSTTERTHVRPSTAGSNTVVAEVDAAQRVSRVDRDVLTRFATGCLALGLTVDGRRRPADLDAALGGFLTLTRIAGEHWDA